MDQSQSATSATPPAADTVPVQAAASPTRGGRLANLALGGAVVLAVAGLAFAAGRMTAPAGPGSLTGNLPNGLQGPTFNQNGGNGGTGFQGGGPGGVLTGGPTVEGTVESITDTTLTIRTASGETVQIALDDTTSYHAQSDASADDVATGGKVLVRIDVEPSSDGQPRGLSASDVTVVP